MKDTVTRELRHYHGRFLSVTEMKVRIAEEFDVRPKFSVGYYDPGSGATKRWLCCDEDITALYGSYGAYPSKEILLWCESSKSEDLPSSKRRKKSSSSREEQETQVEELAEELQEMHEDTLKLSELQYRLWARMIVTGVYSKKDTPPQVPMITGVAPKRNRRSTSTSDSDERLSLQDSIVSTATAVVKAMSSANQSSTSVTQSPQIHQNALGSPALAIYFSWKSCRYSWEEFQSAVCPGETLRR